MKSFSIDSSRLIKDIKDYSEGLIVGEIIQYAEILDEATR